MELYSAVNPLELTAIARVLPEDPQYTLNTALPDRQVPSIGFAIDQIKRTNRAAKFRAYDAPVEIGRPPTLIRQVGELPPLGEGYLVGEYRRLLEQQLQMQGSTISPLVAQAAAGYVPRGVAAIRARMELARGQVLSTGKFTLNNEGNLFGLEADFGVPPGNLVTAGVLWPNTGTANPIADLQGWMNTINLATGVYPDNMILGRTAVQNLVNNDKVKIQLGSLLGAAPAASVPQVNQILAAMDLPNIATTADGRPVRPTRVDVDGTVVDTFPANKVALYTSGAIGETLWGPTFASLEFVSDGIMQPTDAPGITAWVEKDGNPGELFTVVDAVGMPTLEQPWGLLVATVA